MALPDILKHLPLPAIGSPLFIISNPKLVIEQCKAGVVGSMPALNARPAELLDEWLAEITETLAAYNKANPDKPAAPSAWWVTASTTRRALPRRRLVSRWAPPAPTPPRRPPTC